MSFCLPVKYATRARLFMPRDIVVCSVDSGLTQRQAIVNANANVQLPFENLAMEYNPSWIIQTLRDGDYTFSPTLLRFVVGDSWVAMAAQFRISGFQCDPLNAVSICLPARTLHSILEQAEKDLTMIKNKQGVVTDTKPWVRKRR